MKKYFMLLIALLCSVMFLACGDDFDGTTVKFRVPSGTIANALGSMKQDFEANNPTIRIELEPVSGGYDGVLEQNVYDLNDGKAPTMTIGYPDHFALYLSGDNLVSLTPYIERDAEEVNIEDFIEQYLPENKLSDDNDDFYGLPLNKSTELLIYNKTVFDAMNYELPATWSEVETLCEKILEDCEAGKLDDIEGVKFSKDDKKPSAYYKLGTFYPLSYDSTSNAFITILRQWDAKYTERENISKGYALFNNDTAVEALTYFQNLAKKKVFSVAESFDERYASNAFKNLQCLMTIGSSAGIGYNLPSGDKFSLGVAPLPVKDLDNKIVISQGTNVCILAQSTEAEREAAWQFIKYLTSTENTAEFATLTGGYLPVRHSAYETEVYKRHLDEKLNINYHYALSAKASLEYRDNYIMFVDPAFVGSSTIRDEVGTAFSKIIVQKEDIKKVLNDTMNILGPKFKK